MRSWTIPFGRILGVELRLHTLFFILLGFSISYGIYTTENGARGFVLWCLLLLAVLVREAARALAAACLGLELRSLLLLPTGAIPTYGVEESANPDTQQRLLRTIAVVGPITNLAFGAILAAVILTVSPILNLTAQPWVDPFHLLKSLVWVNLLLGAVNLLPALPLDGEKLFRSLTSTPSTAISRTFSMEKAVAIGLVAVGVILGSIWFMVIGFFVLVGAHLEGQGTLVRNEVGAVTLRDVMLTDYTTLSASDTLEDALERAVHSLQDVFPVVRGGTIVGAVSRQSILEALDSGGNSYIQGIMAKSFQIAHPDDALVTTLRRIAVNGGTQFVPVLESERVVGIVTPNHLSHSIRLRGHLPRNAKTRNSNSNSNDR